MKQWAQQWVQLSWSLEGEGEASLSQHGHEKLIEYAQQQHAHLKPWAQFWVQPSFGAVAISQRMALVWEQHSCALRGLLEPIQR